MKQKKYTYEADAIVVTWDQARCTHAAECIRGLPGVFERNRRPWIDPSAASADDVARVIHRCPTGALQYTRLDGGPPEEAGPNEVTVQPNGPLVVRGDLLILGEEGEVILEATRVALCRCGSSSNKPFCDGSHREIRFEEPGKLGPGGVKETDDPLPDGRLRIMLRPNGSLRCTGPFSIRRADGFDERTGTRVSLCRCGKSGNKPFCDGRHKEESYE